MQAPTPTRDPQPLGASTISLRYELDGRYAPELYGGNPCANGSSTYTCSICVDSDYGAWDYDVKVLVPSPSLSPSNSHSH